MTASGDVTTHPAVHGRTPILPTGRRAGPAENGAPPREPSDPVQDREAADEDGQRTRILVVDDHAIVREGIANVLNSDARLVVIGEAGDGYEAIDMIQRQQPDVVLMDVNMPRMNGIEATREVQSRWPGMLTVGLSVQDDAPTAQLMRDAGAAGFVPKSGDSQQMIETIVGLAKQQKDEH